MLTINFSLLCIFIVFAHLSESRLVLLQDDEEEPSFIRHAVSRSNADHTDHDKRPSILNPNNKPKRHSKKTVLHYGRHIYHLDNFKDKITSRQYKPAAVTFNYVDLYHLIRPSILKSGARDYLKDLVIFSESPLHICDGNQCDEDLRKSDRIDKSQYNNNGHLKRFQVVNNRKKPKQPKYQLEEKKKDKPRKKRFQKKNRYSSESKESKESSSEEQSYKKKKKKESHSSSASSEEVKTGKNNDDSNSDSGSHEKWSNDDSSTSEEESKRKKKKRNRKESDSKTKRKTFNNGEQFFVQGSKIFFVRDGAGQIKSNPHAKRRRLEPFLPKRYHWDPEEIHELGYYWFNGPKGIYPAPQLLPTVRSKK